MLWPHEEGARLGREGAAVDIAQEEHVTIGVQEIIAVDIRGNAQPLDQHRDLQPAGTWPLAQYTY